MIKVDDRTLPLQPTGKTRRLKPSDGADASHHRGGGLHPLSVRRFAPSIKRIQATIPRTSKLVDAWGAPGRLGVPGALGGGPRIETRTKNRDGNYLKCENI